MITVKLAVLSNDLEKRMNSKLKGGHYRFSRASPLSANHDLFKSRSLQIIHTEIRFDQGTARHDCLAVAFGLSRLSCLLHLHQITEAIGSGPVPISESVDLGQLAAGQRMPIPASLVFIGG